MDAARTRVAIVGAGPAGAFAADRLLRQDLLATVERARARLRDHLADLQAQSEALTAQLRDLGPVGGVPQATDLVWPTDGPATSGFGYRTHPILGTRRLHAGIDIPAPVGQAIYAVADGTVVSAGVRGGYGNVVVIDHHDGLQSVYAHQSRMAVAAGDRVRASDVIGAIGSTGLSTGPHLHFEIRRAGVPVDPMGWY